MSGGVGCKSVVEAVSSWHPVRAESGAAGPAHRAHTPSHHEVSTFEVLSGQFQFPTREFVTSAFELGAEGQIMDIIIDIIWIHDRDT